jgi:gliding motility-associated-like protein
MKKLHLLLLFFTILFANKTKAQMGCFTPSLGVYDTGSSPFSAMTATIPCNFVDLIAIKPTAFYSGNNCCAPCMQIKFGTTNANSQTNNSLTMSEGSSTIASVCNSVPVPCFTFIPSSSQYSLALAALDPTQSHGYNLCNTNTAASFPYSVTSCYSNVNLATGTWLNNLASNCQTVSITAGAAIGLATYTVSPAVVSTASTDTGTGYLFLDTYQMSAGVYTISYGFNSQVSCSIVSTRTILITNPYNPNWTPAGPLCANAACTTPGTVTGTAGGTFTATAGMSGSTFCPSLVGAGTWPVTYSVGITSQCGSSQNQNIVVNALPVANAGPTKSLTCANNTTVLAGSGGGAYAWSGPGIISGGTTAGPTVGSAGVYSLTVTSGGCASLTSTVAVGFNTVAPPATAGTSGSVTCTNNAVNLTSSPGSMNYTWTAPGGSSITGGVNNQNTTGSGPGTYTVKVVDPSNGCSTTTMVTAQVNTVAPVTSAGTSGSVTCNNNAINLTSTLTGMNYTWTAPGGSSITGGVNSQNATGSGPGTYTVKVQSAVNGCTAQATVAALINTVVPTVTAGTSSSVTCTSSVITLSSGPNGMTYTWTAPGGSSITGGVTNQNTTGSGPGTYTVKATDAVNGCTNIATVAAVVNTVAPTGVTANATSSITCTSSTLSLSGAPGGGTYTWVPPGGGSITGGVNNQNTTGSGVGTYTLIYQSATNGCTAQATAAAPFNTVAPTGVTANATSSITCTSNSLALSGAPGSGGTYTWVAPAGSSITGGLNTQNTTASGPGTYTLIFQSATNGCTAQATASAPFNTVAPTGVSASATSSITCASQTFSLSSLPSSGGTYTWVAPGASSITGGVNNANTTGSGPGTYTVIFQSATNGCTAQATASAPFNTVAPTGISVNTSGTVTCGSTAINLGVSPTGLTYSWTAPAGSSITSGATSPSATGSGPGTYSVVVTGTNGCSAPAATIAAVTNTTAPTQTAIPSQSLTCSTTSLNIMGNPSSGVLYSWLGSGIVGPANTQTVNVVLSGNYTLVVTSTANSCTSAAVAAIGMNTIAPTASGSGSVSITCSTPSVSMIGSANPSSCTVIWSGGVCAGINSYTAYACAPGQYSMTVTNPANGCQSAPAVFTVVPNSNQPSATLVNSNTITCTNTSAQVVATTTSSPVTYTWSGPGIVSGASSPTIVVNQGGTYTLAIQNTLNGCVSIFTSSVTADNGPVTPTTTASNTITCNTTTVNITSGAGAGTYTYNWSGPGIVGSNTLSTITSSLGGTYNVTVTNTSNGCVGTDVVTVVSNTNAPTSVSINPSTFTLSCSTPTTALTATAVGASTYSWIAPGTGAIISGSNSATAGINGPGNYSVVVTGTNGCSAAAFVATVSPNNLAPTFTLSNTSPSITCLSANPTVSVGITSTVGIGSYSWSPGSGISGSATGSVVTFTASGTFTGVITATNGCQSNAIVTVVDATTAPTFVAGTGTASPLSCANPTTIISPAYTPTTDVTYSWSGPGIVGSSTNGSVTVNQNGTYSVIVTNTLTGCVSNSLTVVVVGTTIPPTLNVSSSSSVGLGCSPTNSTNILTANATPTNVTYSWNTSATTSTIVVNTAGTYTVTVVDPITSCSTTTTYSVTNNSTAPTATSVASAIMPCGGAATVTLNGGSPDPGVTYSWTGPSIISGSNTSNPTVDQPGTYTLTVTNPTTGCTSTSTVNVVNGVPVASFTTDITNGFAPQVVNFTNLSSPSATVLTWTFGDGNGSSTTNPSNTYSVAGTYTVMLVASTGLCSDTATEVIVIEDGFTIEIPNVFTPNGDNTNDVFTIKSTGVKEIELQIFNRWGQLMYNFTGAKAAWDGITNSGEKATDGTYFYFIIAKGYDTTKEPVKKNGSLGLFR